MLADGADVDLYARSAFADLVPAGVSVKSLERSELRKLFTQDIEGHEETQRSFAAYAAIYSWLGSQEPAFVTALCRVSAGRAQFFPFRPMGTQARLHQVDHYLSCLNLREEIQREPIVQLRAEAIRWRADFWNGHRLSGRPVLALGAGSGAREKNWPEEFFLRVADWWRSMTGGAVVLPVGPVEEERGGIERLSRRCVTASGLPLAQLAAVLGGSDLYLGNDSGVSHLASAVGVRTVVLFGPSNVAQWQPRGKRVTILRRSIHCSPCEIPVMKSCGHRSCLLELSPEEVIQTLRQLPEVLTLTRR
jgi:ADP-heptose:LPS heptosyltransferase